MGRGTGRRLVAAAMREEEDEEKRWQGAKTDHFSKENQAPAPKKRDTHTVTNGKRNDKPLNVATDNIHPPMLRHAMPTKQPLVLSIDAKRAASNSVNERVTKKPIPSKEKPGFSATQIKKDQFVSFCRWFTNTRIESKFGGFDTDSTNQRAKGSFSAMALVFNQASPDYRVGAIWYNSEPAPFGTVPVDAPSALGLRINTKGEITIEGVARVRFGGTEELVRALVSHPEGVATFTTVEEWKEFVKAAGPKYNERLSARGGKLALLEEVPDWLLEKEVDMPLMRLLRPGTYSTMRAG